LDVNYTQLASPAVSHAAAIHSQLANPGIPQAAVNYTYNCHPTGQRSGPCQGFEY
jgi:hypothetical protein